MTIEEKVIQIKNNLDYFKDDLEKYAYIIKLGKNIKSFDDKEKISTNIVHGCTSQVWLISQQIDEKFYFQGISDSKIINGLIYMIIEIFSGHTKTEIEEAGTEILFHLDLAEIVTPSRQNGLIGMIKKIQEYVKRVDTFKNNNYIL